MELVLKVDPFQHFAEETKMQEAEKNIKQISIQENKSLGASPAVTPQPSS